tara:strand:+ start:7557 stop:8546 length:990 start_codon:yes stop_codon:yes gene_type:complete
MKNKLLLIIVFIFNISSLLAQKTITIEGVVLDKNATALSGILVKEKGKNNYVITDYLGYFSIDVLDDSELLFMSDGLLKKTFKVKGNKNLIAVGVDTVKMNVIIDKTKSQGVSASMKNYWIGAKVGYNFIGETDDNFFVGSASITLNLFDGFNNKENDNWHQYLGVIGNLGNFKFDKETDSSEDVQKIAQSINGLSVGLGLTLENKISSISEDSFFRYFVRTGVRMTTFDKIGVDMESVNLAQSETNTGVELEIGNFKNEGTITIATGVTMYLFDENVYNKIFEEKKSSLFTLDTTIILPISKDLGFYINGTFTKRASAAYILGIIFRS